MIKYIAFRIRAYIFIFEELKTCGRIHIWLFQLSPLKRILLQLGRYEDVLVLYVHLHHLTLMHII